MGAGGKPLPQLASVAQQAGKYCAQRIAAAIAGTPAAPFHSVDKGILAMIGHNAAVVEVGEHRHQLTGPIAFAGWLGVHAVLLPTTLAKIESLVDWGWDYFSTERGDPVLDRPGQVAIDWNEDEQEVEQQRM